MDLSFKNDALVSLITILHDYVLLLAENPVEPKEQGN